MPPTRILFYRDVRGRVPVREWLEDLLHENRHAWSNCVVRLEQLATEGHALRRPAADFLCLGIHELRARQGRTHYRILYFFHGRGAVVLAHALIKEGRIPYVDIARALERKRAYEQNPQAHTHQGPIDAEDQ